MRRPFFAIVMLALLVSAANTFAYEEVTPSESAEMVLNEGAFILDVRTPSEWNWVGHPGENKLGEGAVLNGYVYNVAYKVYHKGFKKGDTLIINKKFVKDVKKLFDEDAAIIVMCRSGKRSASAAAALDAAGFSNVYDMLTGFEGGKDDAGYRTVNGWKINGLPYNYSTTGAYK